MSCRTSLEPSSDSLSDIELQRLQADRSVSLLHSSAVHASERIVVRNEGEWRSAWLRIWGGAPSTPPLPEIDFSRELLVVAARGDVSSSGFEVLVDRATVERERLVVRIRSISPGWTCGVYWVVTQPVDVARISRTVLPIEFEERSEQRTCP